MLSGLRQEYEGSLCCGYLGLRLKTVNKRSSDCTFNEILSGNALNGTFKDVKATHKVAYICP